MMKSSHRLPWLRLSALCLVCCVLLGLFAGCGKAKDSGTDAASSDNTPSQTTAAATEPQPSDPSGTASAPETEGETLPPPEPDPSVDYEGLSTLDVYTLAELPADDARLSNVIAECEEQSMTNRELQMYYYMQFFGYYGQLQQMTSYGYPADMFGLDITKPLSEQDSMEVEGLNWEQYFLMCALNQFHQTCAIEAVAKQEGFTLSDEDKASLQKIKDSLTEQSEDYGFESVDAYIQASFGPSITQQDYEAYLDRYYYVVCYEDEIYNGITWTDDDLLEYFRSNPDKYEDVSELPNVNVRHILITPEDADGDKVSSDEEKAAAKAKAEEILEQYQKDPTEQNFATLANENSTDPGSNEKGGLYEDVYPGQMVQSFNDWCFDEARKPGDTGIVETSYGYHIMYFVSQSDTYHWKSLCEKDYPVSRMETWINEQMDSLPLSVDYASIVIGPMPKAAQQDEN